jgi:arylsulfatase A-like enzyme
MYDEILHVPLIIRHPDGPRGIRVEERVSLIDLAPTILEMLAIPAARQFQGRSLLDRIEVAGEESVIFSEFPPGGRRSLVSRNRKLIATGAREEIYDLERDPGERRNLLGAGAGATARDAALDREAELLRRELDRITRTNASVRSALGAKGSKGELDEATLQRLRALGYIE